MFKRIKRWLSSLLDRARGRYREGITPPIRLLQAVEVFAHMNPRATQEDWIRFAARHAAESYRSGYTRGLEWRNRAPELAEPSTAWSVIESDQRRHDWTWSDLAPSDEQLKQMVLKHSDAIENLSPEERVLYEDMIGQQLGSHRVVLVPMDDPKQR